MNHAARSQGGDPGLSGWDEPGPTRPAWRIEHQAVVVERSAPFFPDQNGGVYEQLLFNLPVLLHCMDGNGRIVTANRHWCITLGYSQAEITGKHFNDFLTSQSRARLVQEIYPSYFQSGQCRGELLEVFRKDGTPVPLLVSMTAYRGAKGRIERSVCLLQGIGGISEHEVANTDRQFRNAFESAAHGMILLASTGEIFAANAAFREFIGRHERDGALGPLDEILYADDRGPFLDAMKRLLAGEIPVVKQEMRFMSASGQVVHGATSVSVVRDDKMQIDHFVVQVIDLSERRQTELQLLQAQRMEAIGQLTGGLAHDFNNLLTVIIGNLQLIDLALKDHPKAHKRALEAIEAARKGSGLTKQLLAFARRQALEPEEVNVNDLVRAMAPLVSRTIGESIQLKIDLMPGQPKTLIDPSQLESAILNLAINARDAMSSDGLLTIETLATFLDETYAASNPEVNPGHYVMIAVSDTGKGIPPDILQKVFQPFFTTKPVGRGSGLGLSQVYGFIKQSGGHIQIYSEIGHGTSIKMYLPRRFAAGEAQPEYPHLERDSGKAPSHPKSPVQAEPKRKKILVVEDQEAVRTVACNFLTDFGYDVIEADNGMQALGRLQEHPDIDLMFTDVVMPGGMNGFDLAQAAYAIRPNLKVVHTSGYPRGAMVHQEEPRFREGFIIMKPYRREDLQKIIGEALEQQT